MFINNTTVAVCPILNRCLFPYEWSLNMSSSSNNENSFKIDRGICMSVSHIYDTYVCLYHIYHMHKHTNTSTTPPSFKSIKLILLKYWCWKVQAKPWIVREWYLSEKVMAPHTSTLAWKMHGRRSLVGCSPWGREESDTTERLHFHFWLSCIGERNGNPLQCSCLENPRDGGAGGVAQSRTRLKRLSIA